MKKMAKFLAAVLAVSMLPTFGAFADATYDWNFDDLSESLSTGDYADGVETHKWYQKGHVALMTCSFNDGESTQQLDADHALSGKLVGNGSFIFTLNYDEASQDNYKRAALVDGETIDLSFDVAVTEVKKAGVIFGQNGGFDWCDHLFMADGGKGWNNGEGWGDANFAKAFDLGDWVRLGFVITRNGDDVNVEKYIDGTFIGEQTVASSKFTSVCVFGRDGAKVYVDNVNVATYTETHAIWDFSEDSLSSKRSSDNLWADGNGEKKWFQAGNVSLWTNADSGESIWTTDEEHGYSGILINGGAFAFVLNTDDTISDGVDKWKRAPLNDGDNIHIGFDIAMDSERKAYIRYGDPSAKWDDGTVLSLSWGKGWCKGGDSGNVVHDVDANEWARFDFSISREGDTTYVDEYINGNWFDTRTFTDDSFKNITIQTGKDESIEASIKVYLDNVTVDSPRHGTKINAKATAVKADALSSEIIFDHTLERAESKGGSEFYTLNVEEKNLETNATSNFTVDAFMDTTATKLTIDWDPDGDKESMLNYNCQYTISLPIDNSRNAVVDENNTFLKGIESAGKYTGDVITSTVSFTTPDNDEYYETFESYTQDQTIPKLNMSYNQDTTTPYGQALVCNGLTYMLPNNLVGGAAEGKYIVSFDINVKSVSEGGHLVFDPNGGYNRPLLWKPDGSLCTDWSTSTGTNHEHNTWKHYDVVFDYTTESKKLTAYQDGVLLNTLNTVPDPLYRIQFWTEGGNSEFAIDNWHVRFEDNNKVTTTIGDTLNVATTATTIKFEDAVSVASLNDIAITGGRDMDDVEFTLSDATPYGVTINFKDAFEADQQYTINLSKVKSLAGEALSKDSIVFTAAETPTVLTISDVAIADLVGTSWDNSKAYDVTITAENTKYPEGKVASFIIAGYNSDGMVNAQVKPVTIGETGASLTLDAIDMTGATSFKCFIIDSLSNLAPLMNAAKIIK